jgi:hypothetical protein
VEQMGIYNPRGVMPLQSRVSFRFPHHLMVSLRKLCIVRQLSK